MSGSQNSIEALAAAVRAGDSSGFDELCRRCIYLPEAVVSFGARFGLERDDLYQEATLALLHALHSYDPERSSFRTYAAVCIEHQLRAVLRAGGRQKNRALVDYVSLEDVDFAGVGDPESDWIRKEELFAQKEAIFSALSPLESEVLSLYVNGLSYREIAEKLRKTEKSVGNALSRIRNKLRPKGTGT